MLEYATPTPSALPIVEHDGPRLRIHLDPRRIFPWQLVLVSLALVATVAATPYAREWADRARNAVLAVVCGLGLTAVVRSRSDASLIEADDAGVTGPMSSRVPREHILRFEVRRLACPWLAEVVAVTVGRSLRKRNRVVLAVTRTRDARPLVEALNGWQGGRVPAPVNTTPVVQPWWFYPLLLGVFAASLAPAGWLMRAGFNVEPNAATAAELYFAAGLFTAVLPVTLTAIIAMRDSSQQVADTAAKPPRLHRNNAAEWAMVFALTPICWAVRAWASLRGREKIRVPVRSASPVAPTVETP